MFVVNNSKFLPTQEYRSELTSSTSLDDFSPSNFVSKFKILLALSSKLWAINSASSTETQDTQ